MLDVGRAVDAGLAERIRHIACGRSSTLTGRWIDANRAHERRWLSANKTMDGMVALDGLLDAEAGALVLTALASASPRRGLCTTTASIGQRRADALVEICGVSLDHGQLASSGGVRPHLLVTAPVSRTDRLGRRSAPPRWARWPGRARSPT